eukprot:2916522-Karenia_brevis.AAC.1
MNVSSTQEKDPATIRPYGGGLNVAGLVLTVVLSSSESQERKPHLAKAVATRVEAGTTQSLRIADRSTNQVFLSEMEAQEGPDSSTRLQ